MEQHDRQNDQSDVAAPGEDDRGKRHAGRQRLLRSAEGDRDHILLRHGEKLGDQKRHAIDHQKEDDRGNRDLGDDQRIVAQKDALGDRVRERTVDDGENDPTVGELDEPLAPLGPSAEPAPGDLSEHDRQEDQKDDLEDRRQERNRRTARLEIPSHQCRRQKDAEEARKGRIEDRDRDIAPCQRDHGHGGGDGRGERGDKKEADLGRFRQGARKGRQRQKNHGWKQPERRQNNDDMRFPACHSELHPLGRERQAIKEEHPADAIGGQIIPMKKPAGTARFGEDDCKDHGRGERENELVDFRKPHGHSLPFLIWVRPDELRSSPA